MSGICRACKKETIEVSYKDSYVDDFAEDCLNPECYEYKAGSRSMRNISNRMAKAEAEEDRMERFRDHDEEE